MRGLYILLSLAASSLAAPAFSERAVCTFVCPTQDKLGGALVGATISLLGILDCTYVGLPSSVSCTYIGGNLVLGLGIGGTICPSTASCSSSTTTTSKTSTTTSKTSTSTTTTSRTSITTMSSTTTSTTSTTTSSPTSTTSSTTSTTSDSSTSTPTTSDSTTTTSSSSTDTTTSPPTTTSSSTSMTSSTTDTSSSSATTTSTTSSTSATDTSTSTTATTTDTTSSDTSTTAVPTTTTSSDTTTTSDTPTTSATSTTDSSTTSDTSTSSATSTASATTTTSDSTTSSDTSTSASSTTSTSTTTTSSASPTSTPGGFSPAYPCALDTQSRVFANPEYYQLTNNSIEKCTSLCGSRGYTLAGIEYTYECFCASAYTNGTLPTPAPASQCNKVCPGNTTETCGGGYRIQIYNNPTALQDAAALPAGWTQTIPCAVDTPSRIFADTANFTLANNTPANCINQCSSLNYTLAGVEDAQECYCGTSYRNGTAPAAIATSKCNTACSGAPGLTCGGGYAIQVYASQ